MSIWYRRTAGFAKFVKPPYPPYVAPSGVWITSSRRPRFHAARRDRVAEADEPADHADALVVQQRDGVRRGRRRRLDRADLVRERDGRVPADLPRLVLQVELDRVDPPLGDQVEHALPQRSSAQASR